MSSSSSLVRASLASFVTYEAERAVKPRPNKAGPICSIVAELPAEIVRATSPEATYMNVPGIIPRNDAGMYCINFTLVRP